MTTDPTPTDHHPVNRAYWDGIAADYAAVGRRAWAQDEPTWGIWGIPQSELPVLPADLAGKDLVELGCGNAYVSAWAARRGARPVGIDLSPRQLAVARALQDEHGLHFPLVEGSAERLPFDDASFDVAISEYGAATWCDPYRWIPEAARVLRPGGLFVMLRSATLFQLCEAQEGVATDRLLRPLFGLHRLEWDDPEGPSVDFQLPHGRTVALLRSCGLVLEELVEVQPPAGATTESPHVDLAWARRWPTEEVWVARRSG